ncbi:MAG: M1 family metallopeptidase [Bacteroidales bacterium]
MRTARILLIISLFLISGALKAQAEYEAYWQQRADYTIKAAIDTETDILTGRQSIVYHNNSPHHLDVLYFHLYQNAFQPGSYMDKKFKAAGRSFDYGHYESQGKTMEVDNVRINDRPSHWEVDNAIMHIPLEQPLAPGDSLIVEMDFKTYFDLSATWRRMRVYKAYGVKNYNGGHWYPRISVFDRKSGWTADQHMLHEFYGNFGTYDVRLDIPQHYIVDATGILQNKEEAMPSHLREKLDISNFKDKPMYSAPSEVIPPTDTLKTWHFRARNVHDFAFVASPLFRIGETEWNGIRCRSLAMEPHAAKWQDAAQLAADIIQIFSNDFGMYAYPKMIVADVQAGMEYPMLTMNSGHSPGYTYLFTHEIAHNWFFAAVGSNETYRAALDEGFTQYLTYYGLKKLSKYREIEFPPPPSFPLNQKKQHELPYKIILQRYYKDAFYKEGTRLNQHSDKILTDEPYGIKYRQTYNKTAAMLMNLQYVLGDSLFKACMRHYYETWKFRQPYLEDMRNAFINHSGVNLNWFFDQWLNSKKTIDYAIRKVKRNGKNGAEITLQRKGRMEMPVDVLVIDNNRDSTLYHIPNRNFIKQTDAVVLDKWFGWDQLNPSYTFTARTDSKVKNVIIDPFHRIADMNRLNNHYKPHASLDFDYLTKQPENPYRYELYARPDFWWNDHDGLKAGISVEGDYMKELHEFDVSVLYNTGLLSGPALSGDPLAVSWHFNYRTRIGKAPGKAFLNLSSIRDIGWSYHRAGIQQQSTNNKNTYGLSISGSRMHKKRPVYYMPDRYWDSYLLETAYLYLQASYDRELDNGRLSASITSSLGQIINSKINVCLNTRRNIGSLILRNRGFFQYGLSQYYPIEDALLLSGGNMMDMMHHKIVRSPGIIPSQWYTYGNSPNHFHQPGGLNLRGYSGYISAKYNEEGEPEYQHMGNTGLGVNQELSTARIFQPLPPKLRKFLQIDLYAFYGLAILDNASISSLPDFSRLYMDAGIGTQLDIRQWWQFDKLKPLTLRFDMPLFLNIKPKDEKKHFKFRWLLGVEKSL